MASTCSAAVLLAILAALGLAACGGSGSGTAASAGSTGSAGASEQGGAHGKDAKARGEQGGGGQGAATEQGAGGQPPRGGGERAGHRAKGSVPGDTSAHFTPQTHGDSGGGAGQFEEKGGDNSIQESGSETSGAEFAAGATALHGYLDARAAGAWASACEYLAAGITTQLSGQSGGEQPSCAELLYGLSAGIPPSALREVAQADVGSFRVEGDSGFLLFHGAQGIDYFVPMVREGGEWKVAAIAPSAIP